MAAEVTSMMSLMESTGTMEAYPEIAILCRRMANKDLPSPVEWGQESHIAMQKIKSAKAVLVDPGRSCANTTADQIAFWQARLAQSIADWGESVTRAENPALAGLEPHMNNQQETGARMCAEWNARARLDAERMGMCAKNILAFQNV